MQRFPLLHWLCQPDVLSQPLLESRVFRCIFGGTVFTVSRDGSYPQGTLLSARQDNILWLGMSSWKKLLPYLPKIIIAFSLSFFFQVDNYVPNFNQRMKQWLRFFISHPHSLHFCGYFLNVVKYHMLCRRAECNFYYVPLTCNILD